MSVEFSTHGRYENFVQSGVRNLTGRGSVEDLGVDWRIILEWILEK